jgi:hypothetical protein
MANAPSLGVGCYHHKQIYLDDESATEMLGSSDVVNVSPANIRAAPRPHFLVYF